MKKHILFILVLISSYSYSQENNKSLLWEISGNNLSKKSYLYGTMHVSKKVAFRLDDVFFKALNNSECIALESDPTTWLNSTYESIRLSDNKSYFNRSNFYEKLFNFEYPNELAIRNSVRFDNRMINGYLYRKDGFSDNFEEETYIDMFIYQAGKKKGKPIIGLENLEESRYLTSKARTNVRKKKIDPWLLKLMAKKNRFTFQENVYRERNIELLDSIGAASNSEYFREHMLFKRNANMVTVLDSVMQHKSVFAGVGAAHLGGEKGMLKMLKKKGYTVKPITSTQTSFAKQQKKELENLKTKPELKLQKTPDNFISIKSFDKLREFNYKDLKYYAALDMKNGAYLTIIRFNSYPFLPNKEPITLESLDNLLYEDIPGDIIKKEKINSPYPGIRIVNKTTKGDYQKYEIYKTPFENCIIKLGGKNDFTLNYGDEIFNSLKFKPSNTSFKNYKEPFNKYTLKFPEYYISNNLNYPGNKSLQGFDGSDYYFLQESPIHDISYLEDDTFEAKYIHTSFYKKFDLKEINGKQNNNNYKSYESYTETDSITHTQLHLKSIIKDGSYYLLGYSGKSMDKAKEFFNSFKFSEIDYDNFKKTIDTSLLFSVNTTTKAPTSYSYFSYKKLKPYDESSKSTTYTSKANEKIYVTRTKYHDLQMYANIDSLWSSFKSKKRKISNYKSKNLDIKNEKKYTKNNTYIYEYTKKDTASYKTIYTKKILKKGVCYSLTTLIDSISKPSKFVSEFYDSFTPLDTLLGKDVLANKTNTYFKAIRNNDSIVLKAYKKVKFKDGNTTQLIDLIKTHDFPKDREKIKAYLVYELGQLNDAKITPFLTQLYKESYTKPNIQIAVLRTLISKKTTNSYKTVLSLMETDLPLSSSTAKSLFTKKDSLELNKNLFPELLNYLTIAEYKKPIYSLLTQLVDSNIVKPKQYKKYITQINNDAKIEIKRGLGKTFFSYSSSKNNSLNNYVKLLFPFKNNKKVDAFFSKLIKSEDYNALTTYYALLKENNNNITKSLKNKTESKLEAQALLAKKLNKKKLNHNLSSIISQQQYAKSALFATTKLKEKDSVIFINKKDLKTDTNKNVVTYFFKFKRYSSNYGDSASLYYISFLKPKNNTVLVTKTYYKSRRNGVYMNESKTIEDYIEDALKLIKHKDRKRINNNQYFSFH